MNASQYRKTRFELAALLQGTNSFRIRASERGVFGSNVELEVPEEAFSDAEMTQVQDALGVFEAVFARVFDAKAVEHDPVTVHNLIQRGELAKIETARAEAEAIIRKAELDEEIEAKESLLSALRMSA